ncbi:MAG: ABC transporter permease [Chloroflexia bacterium]|nr:ABC transporter permease [Chloroflexia bacterium]
MTCFMPSPSAARDRESRKQKAESDPTRLSSFIFHLSPGFPMLNRTTSWLISLGVLLLIWQVASGFYPAAILPSPGETLAGLRWLLTRASFYEHLKLTAWRGAAGFTLAMAGGTLLGLLIGRSRLVAQLLNPLIVIATIIPPVFWVAVMIIWMGLGSGPPILVVVITATPLVAVNVAQGVQSVPPQLIEMARIFQVSRMTRLRELYLPSLSGYLFAGALIAVRFAWRTVIMAEFIGSTKGLGNRLAWARQNLEMDLAFAYLLIIVAMGMLIEYGLLRPAKQRLVWDAERHQRDVVGEPTGLRVGPSIGTSRSSSHVP